MGQRGWFDGNGHMTMQEKPRFALGVYDSGGPYSNNPAEWERQIFDPSGERGLAGIPINLYLNYYWGAVPIEQTRVLLDVLQRHGVMYIQTGNAFESGGWTRPELDHPFSIGQDAYVQAFARHPAAWGYYIADEPYDFLVPETAAHRQRLKTVDPEGLTFVALMAGWPSESPTRTEFPLWVNAGTADVYGTDPYPISNPRSGPPPDYPHFMVGDYLSHLRAAVPADRPVWAVLQLFAGLGSARLPTREEMRYHAVAAIVEGAQGIFWWDIGVSGLRKENAATVVEYMGYLRELVSELAGLEPVLLAEDYSQYLTTSTTFANPVTGRLAQLQHNVANDWLQSRKDWYKTEIAALLNGDHSQSGGMLVRAADVRTRALVIPGLTAAVFAYNYRNVTQPVTYTAMTAPPFSWRDVLEPYGARIYVLTQENGVVVIRESRSGETFPINMSPSPPAPIPTPVPVPAPSPTPTPVPSPAASSVAWLHPAEGATVSGVVGIGGSTTVLWSSRKSWALLIDGVRAFGNEGSGSTWWPSPGWNTASSPNGSHVLTLEVTADGQTARADRTVTVRNS